MIGKLTKGNGFGPLLSYLFRKTASGMERATLLGGTLAGESIADLRRELEAISRLRRAIQKPVRHLSISLRPGEHLSMEEWLLVAQRVVQEMGWDSYCVIQHHDQPHEHIHIVASRIRADGSLAREVLRDFRKIEGALRVLEEQFGLEPVASPTRSGRIHQKERLNSTRPRGKERALAERTGLPTIKQKIRLVVDQSIEAANECWGVRPFPRFLEEFRARGGSASLNIRGARITGITFEFEGELMKGSDLGKPYGFANLAKVLKYDPALDLTAISPDTALDRANQHIRRIKDEGAGNSIAPWSSRATRITEPSPELGGRVAGAPSSREMEPSPGVGNLEGHGRGFNARGKEEDLGDWRGPREDPQMGSSAWPNAQRLGVPGSAEAAAIPGRTPDLCVGNSDGAHLDRGSSGSVTHIPGEPDGPNPGLHGGPGRDASTSSFDHHVVRRQRSIASEASQALGLGGSISPVSLPPLASRSLRALALVYLPKLTRWFTLRTRLKLSPEPEKSLIHANDDSWSMRLTPCLPDELPARVERLAETSLAHGSHEDRGEAYWAADDAIREAYNLHENSDPLPQEQGFAGWLDNRLSLVRSGWKRLVELSEALAQKIGDPHADIEREDRAKSRAPFGDRWRRASSLEPELEDNRVRDSIENQPRQPPAGPKGFSR
ncbi:relaxase/mobilization nuclease domain-containing protein [Geothrix sp.]|uniref:relaxase/mobilization nuclease domain-containing protein n=1 Tax=Geothrix sp. TaxID=1962974 RepID=UPI00344DAF14